MDSKMETSVPLLIIGGSALKIILVHDPSGTTKDVDTLSDLSSLKSAYEEAKGKQEIDAKLERVTVAEYPYNFEARIKSAPIDGLKMIQVCLRKTRFVPHESNSR